MKLSNVKALTEDRVLVKVNVVKGKYETKAGIEIPEAYDPVSTFCTVVKTGPGRVLPFGKQVPMTVKEGDVILYEPWHNHYSFKDEDDDCVYIFLRETEIGFILGNINDNNVEVLDEQS